MTAVHGIGTALQTGLFNICHIFEGANGYWRLCASQENANISDKSA